MRSNWYQIYKDAGVRDFFSRYSVLLPALAVLVGGTIASIESLVYKNPNIVPSIVSFIEENRDKIESIATTLPTGSNDIGNQVSLPNSDTFKTEYPVQQSAPSTRVISDNIVDMIKKHEGFSDVVYKCTKGKPTIGYGFNLENEYFRKKLGADFPLYLRGQKSMSRDISDRLLIDYISDVAIPDAISAFPNISKYPADVQKIIVNMSYQMGGSRLRGFKDMRSALDKGDLSAAADEMENSAWYSQTTNRAKELVGYMRKLSVR